MKAKHITFHRKKDIPYFDMSIKAAFNIERPILWLLRKVTGNDDLVFVRGPAAAPPDVIMSSDNHKQRAEYEHNLVTAAMMPIPDDDYEEIKVDYKPDVVKCYCKPLASLVRRRVAPVAVAKNILFTMFGSFRLLAMFERLLYANSNL